MPIKRLQRDAKWPQRHKKKQLQRDVEQPQGDLKQPQGDSKQPLRDAKQLHGDAKQPKDTQNEHRDAKQPQSDTKRLQQRFYMSVPHGRLSHNPSMCIITSLASSEVRFSAVLWQKWTALLKGSLEGSVYKLCSHQLTAQLTGLVSGIKRTVRQIYSYLFEDVLSFLTTHFGL